MPFASMLYRCIMGILYGQHQHQLSHVLLGGWQAAEVDIRNASNATPLHHAAMNNHIRVVERLLEVSICMLPMCVACWGCRHACFPCVSYPKHDLRDRHPHTHTCTSESPSSCICLCIYPPNICALCTVPSPPTHKTLTVPAVQAHANPLAVAKNNWTPMLMAFRQGHMECGRSRIQPAP